MSAVCRCGDTETLPSEDRSTVGAIVPLYLGHPYLKGPEYSDATAALLTATTPTYVVLDVFSPAAGNLDAELQVHADNEAKWSYAGHADYSKSRRASHGA